VKKKGKRRPQKLQNRIWKVWGGAQPLHTSQGHTLYGCQPQMAYLVWPPHLGTYARVFNPLGTNPKIL